MLQCLGLKHGEEGLVSPPSSCAPSVLSQALHNKDCLLLALCIEQKELALQAPPPAPSHVQTASSYLDSVSCRDANATRTSRYARHVTNTGAGNKSFSKKQIEQSYPKHSLSSVYRGQAFSSSYSSFPKYICLVQKAELTSQLQDQESRMFTEHR